MVSFDTVARETYRETQHWGEGDGNGGEARELWRKRVMWAVVSREPNIISPFKDKLAARSQSH